LVKCSARFSVPSRFHSSRLQITSYWAANGDTEQAAYFATFEKALKTANAAAYKTTNTTANFTALKATIAPANVPTD
jgi:hypothetical protein